MAGLLDFLGPVGAIAGGLLSGNSKNTASNDRNPWAGALPWIQNNMVSGQNLQNMYAAQPMSAAQRGAYQNSANGSNAFSNNANGLLGQINNAPFFDRTRPMSRPTPYNFGPIGQLGRSGNPVAVAGADTGFDPGMVAAVDAAMSGYQQVPTWQGNGSQDTTGQGNGSQDTTGQGNGSGSPAPGGSAWDSNRYTGGLLFGQDVGVTAPGGVFGYDPTYGGVFSNPGTGITGSPFSGGYSPFGFGGINFGGWGGGNDIGGGRSDGGESGGYGSDNGPGGVW